MDKNRPMSISMARQQGTGGNPSVGVLLGGNLGLMNAHPSVGGLLVGKIGGQSADVNRPAGVLNPIGDWPEKWADHTHEIGGRGVDSQPEGRLGEHILVSELRGLYIQHGIEEATVDVSGAYLDLALVKAGCILEMNLFMDMKVYDCVPRSYLATTGGKIIGTMWIDTNKEDRQNPNVRCRLVGKEFRTGPDDELFGSTPPLEALRLVISRGALTGRNMR